MVSKHIELPKGGEDRIKGQTRDPVAEPEYDITSRTYNVLESSDRDAVLGAWFGSLEYVSFENERPEVVTQDELRAAQTKLYATLESNGVNVRKYSRNRVFRVYINPVKGLYLEIREPYLDIQRVNTKKSQIPPEIVEKIDASVDVYDEWRSHRALAILRREVEHMLPLLEQWLSDNNISLTGGGAIDLFELGDSSEDELVSAEIDLRQDALTEQIEESRREQDSEAITRLEAQKSALAYAEASEEELDFSGEDWGSPEDTSDYDPSEDDDEWPDDEGVDWDALEADQRTETAVDQIVSRIDTGRITSELTGAFYEDLDRRGIGKLRPVVRVNQENGEVYVGAVEGYLEGVALPYGLDFDERREFVKAVKQFENSKRSKNDEVLAVVATELGVPAAEKKSLLAYSVPQFTVRKDYLNEYVERAQPYEVDAIENSVQELLGQFVPKPTKELFNELQPMIESLFRYDPSSVVYHNYLDRMVEAADSAELWKTSARYRMPNYRRLQSKAASVYGERGYVPVAEDPVAGLEDYLSRVVANTKRITEGDPVYFYSLFDPDVYLAVFEDQGADAESTYLGHGEFEDLPECVGAALDVQRGVGSPPPPIDPGSPLSDIPEYSYSFEMEFGNFDKPTIRRCQNLERMVLPRQNVSLELLSTAVFDSIRELYRYYALATDVEIDITYGDSTDIGLPPGFGNNIRIEVGETFGQDDVIRIYEQMTNLLADIIVGQEIDLDPEDADLDGEDLLNDMRIPVINKIRPNPAGSRRDIHSILEDLTAISEQNSEYEVDLEKLKSIYEECMDMEIDRWDMSQFVGETRSAASERRQTLAAMIGLDRYLPYDVTMALDDEDFEDLIAEFQIAIKDALSTYSEEAAQLEHLKLRLESKYRDLVFPKYFPKGTVRVVHITANEADEFVKAHHSLMGETGINRRGLLATIGAEVDGRLVAVATMNTPTGKSSDSQRESDLSRVASDGSVKGVSSFLSSIVLDLNAENKLSRNLEKTPLFITYSTIDEVGSTYMALLDKGLRPVDLYIPPKKVTGSKAGGASDIYAIPKIKWEAGDDARPANLDIARFLKIKYADEILKDTEIATVGQPWGDDYICLCILTAIKFPSKCASYVKALKATFRASGSKETSETRKVRNTLIQYADGQMSKSDPIRRRNIEKYMRPIRICGQITASEGFTDESRRVIRRNIQRIRQRLQDVTAVQGCSVNADVKKALSAYEKSL